MDTNPSVEMFQKVLENQMLQTTKIVEEELDAEIQKLDQMDEDDLEHVKQRRLEALKKAQQQKQVIFSPALLNSDLMFSSNLCWPCSDAARFENLEEL